MATSAPAGAIMTPGQSMQDSLVRLFQQRQSGFKGVGGTGMEIPGFEGSPDALALAGGGLAWGHIDPSWLPRMMAMASARQPPGQPGNIVEAVAEAIRGRRTKEPDVHGGPADDVVRYDPQYVPGNPQGEGGGIPLPGTEYGWYDDRKRPRGGPFHQEEIPWLG